MSPTPPSPDRPLLALDTSGPVARVALVAPSGEALASASRAGDRHSAHLLPLCHEVLSARGVTVASLAGIACGRGPGSFTGLRVGLAVAKGLCLPFDLPLLLVSSLEALALQLSRQRPEAGLLVPCIDAGKGELYAQLFTPAPGGVTTNSDELRLLPTALLERLAAEAATPLLAGNGLDRHAEVLSQSLPATAVLRDFPGPSAEAVAHLALPRLAAGERDDLAAAVPSYGRPPDITKSKKKL